MPRRNLQNRQPPIKGNVESNDFRLLLWTSLRDLTMLICMSTITLAFLLVVLFYQPPSCPSRPCHAQPHPPHNPQFKCLYFLLYVSSSVGHNIIFHRVFRFALPVATSFPYIRIIDAPSTVLSSSSSHLFPSYLIMPGCFTYGRGSWDPLV